MLSTIILSAGILLHPAHLASQIRSSTFDIFVSGALAGTEVYSVSGGGPDEGITIRSESVMRGTSAPVTAEARYDPAWRPIQVQYTAGGPIARRSFLQFGARRITFRAVSAEGERARELPASGPVVVIHDALASLFLATAHMPAGNVFVIEPENGERSSGVLVDHGTDETHRDSTGRPLNHVELRMSDGARHVWFDGSGNLARVEIPARQLVATPHNVR